VFDGATNSESFRGYVIDALAPVLRSGDIVILDNLPAHKLVGVGNTIEGVGARLLYLAPYSPNSDSIEEEFAKFRAELRSAVARNIPDLWGETRKALDRFTPFECRNYLAAAGYEDELAVAT
jgi:transposase